MSDEFFVGYLPTPPDTARRMRRVAFTLCAAAGAVAALLAWATGPFDHARFEYDKAGAWEGTVEASAVPVLLAKDGGRVFPLVASGKHGAGPEVLPFDASPVRFEAKRILRGKTTMLEIVPGTIVKAETPATGAPGPEWSIAHDEPLTFAGEIVDSKCFLGVMNPGRLEVHRACAKRCIAGGVPPMLYVHDEEGREAHLLLVDENGGPLNDRIVDLVGRPVSVEGRLRRRGELDYLYVLSVNGLKSVLRSK